MTDSRIRFRAEPSIKELALALHGEDLPDWFATQIMNEALINGDERVKKLASALERKDVAEEEIRVLSAKAWSTFEDLRKWFRARGITMGQHARSEGYDGLSLDDSWSRELHRSGAVPGRKKNMKISAWIKSLGLQESTARAWFAEGWE